MIVRLETLNRINLPRAYQQVHQSLDVLSLEIQSKLGDNKSGISSVD